jgi:sulfoxide reductase heme-binding subunit YedZ
MFEPPRESQNKPGNAPVQRRRSSGTVQRTTRPLPGWIDWLVLLVALVIAAISILWTIRSGTFNVSLTEDQLWSWHLVRACGLIAYTLLAASTLWGVFLSSRVIKDWSPGPLSLLLHATTSWLAVIFSVVHALLLLFDNFYHYEIANLLIPFTGPYRPLWVGLGVISFWFTLVITVSFSVRKLIGQRTWSLLHYTSYAVFALVSLHALESGTDAIQGGVQIILGGFLVAVMGLMFFRIGQAVRNARQRAAK